MKYHNMIIMMKNNKNKRYYYIYIYIYIYIYNCMNDNIKEGKIKKKNTTILCVFSSDFCI